MRLRDHAVVNVGLAFQILYAHRLRSTLTMLGVAAGTATVMVVSALVAGLRGSVLQAIDAAGPTTFYVMRAFSSVPIPGVRIPHWILVRPDLTVTEAEQLGTLPEIAYAALWARSLVRIQRAGESTQPIWVVGADDGFPRVEGGMIEAGRWFTRGELAGASPVVVLDARVAARVFGNEPALEAWVRVGWSGTCRSTVSTTRGSPCGHSPASGSRTRSRR